MFCNACGKEVTSINHVVFIDGEACCRETLEEHDAYPDNPFYPYGQDQATGRGLEPPLVGEELEPFWFGGTTNEEGEVYGG